MLGPPSSARVVLRAPLSSFLRPALVRRSQTPTLLASSSSSSFPSRRHVSTAPVARATTSRFAPPPPPSAASSSSSSQTAPSRREGPWRVGRTPSNNLAVYHISKRGGNLKLTELKKIEGDRHALKAQMVRELGFPVEDVKINGVTGAIHIKGKHRDALSAWLVSKGF